MKKRFNKWLNKQSDIVFNIVVWGIVIICIGCSVGITYLIGNSNLPDWLKFWLLK